MVWLLVLNVNGTSPVRISKIYLYGQLYKYKFIFGLFFHCSRPYEEVQVRQLLQFLHALRVGFHNLLVIEKHPLVPLLHMRDVVPGVHRRSFVRDKGKKLVPRRNVLSPRDHSRKRSGRGGRCCVVVVSIVVWVAKQPLNSALQVSGLIETR